jgi:hypothetical protein
MTLYNIVEAALKGQPFLFCDLFTLRLITENLRSNVLIDIKEDTPKLRDHFSVNHDEI